MADPTDAFIAERLRMARARRKVTLRDVADAIAIPAPSLCHWESGRTTVPAHALRLLAGFYRVHSCWLLGCDMHLGEG